MNVIIDSQDFKCTIPIERRVTYIRGDSGVGKSTLVERVRSYLRGNDYVKVESPMKIIIWDRIDEELLNVCKNRIIFMEDIVNSKGVDFISKLISSGNYLIIFNREDFGYDDYDVLIMNRDHIFTNGGKP